MGLFKLIFMSLITIILLPLMLIGAHGDLSRLLSVLHRHWKIKLGVKVEEKEAKPKQASFTWIANAIRASFSTLKKIALKVSSIVFTFQFALLIAIAIGGVAMFNSINEEIKEQERNNLLSNVVYSALSDIRDNVSKDGIESVNLNKINTLAADDRIDVRLEGSEGDAVKIILSMAIPNKQTCEELSGLESKDNIISVTLDERKITSEEDYPIACKDNIKAEVVYLK